MTAVNRASALTIVLILATWAAASNFVGAAEGVSTDAVEPTAAGSSGQLLQTTTIPDAAAYVAAIDTLPARTSPAEMAARCRDMDVLLRACNRTDPAMSALLHDIRREEKALRGIWPRETAYLVSGPCAGLLVGLTGGWIGNALYPEPCLSGASAPGPSCPAGVVLGFPAGCGVGYLAGVAISNWRRASLVATHRSNVDGLVRRFNRAVTEAP